VQPDNQPADIDALIARRDAALDAPIVIMSAEQPVMLARNNALSADTDLARQRLADARDRLAAIEQHADPDTIAAARREAAARRDDAGRCPARHRRPTTGRTGQWVPSDAGHRLGHHGGTRGRKTSTKALRGRALGTAVLPLRTRLAQVGRLQVAIPLQRLSARRPTSGGRFSPSWSQVARSLISRPMAVPIALVNGTSWWIKSTRSTPAFRSAVASTFPTN
jgi:hypothetical protein